MINSGLIPECKDEKLTEMLTKAFEGKGKDHYVDDPEIIRYSLKVLAKDIKDANES